MTPPRSLLRLGWAFHRALFRATGGRIGTQRAADGLGTLFLLSRGRKSGAIRKNALFYVDDGSAFVVVASNAGGNADPSWWLNLQANPDAEIALAGDRIAVRAREASATERDRLWSRLEALNPRYATYRSQSGRNIPIVVLERR
jgi:F420H(2)-dependent quinone reductase